MQRRASIKKTSYARKPSLKLARTMTFDLNRKNFLGYQSKMLAGKGEKKTIDLSVTTYACDTTGSVTCLNLCATGTDYTDRVGRKILLKSVNIIGKLVPQDTTVGNSMCRIMVIYDKQPSGSLPSILLIVTGKQIGRAHL